MSHLSNGKSAPEDAREQALSAWFRAVAPDLASEGMAGELVAVSGDASFRRYFRGYAGDQPCILMDAPPELEDCGPFLRLARILREGGVNVPRVLAVDSGQGFICLEDFGAVLFLDSLASGSSADTLYARAMDQLLLIQQIPAQVLAVPAYDAALLQREMALFRDWLCLQLLGLELSSSCEQLLHETFEFLCAAALAQPVAGVHRDFHSRNLMDRGEAAPGVIDFQDAVWGPLSYDLVSLLKDCYIAWPRDRVLGWLGEYHGRALAAGLPVPAMASFIRDVDLMGVQRHLKASGIFARLWLRDGKRGYLQDIPRTLAHITALAGLYPELSPFIDWCEARVMPRLAAALRVQEPS